MALSNAQLTALYTTANQGAAPVGAALTAIAGIATQSAGGLITDSLAQIAVGRLLYNTVGVAALSYAYFGNTLPSAAGMAFLVSSPANAADLNDPYYAQFNQENRFLNFALNLAVAPGSDYAASFLATFGSKSYLEVADLAYEAVISSAAARSIGADPAAAKASFASGPILAFYEGVVQQRGGYKTTDASYTLAVKAAIVSGIINAAVNANLGAYADAYAKLIVDLETGVTNKLGQPIFTAYPPAPGGGGTGSVFTANIAGFNTATASNSVEGIATSGANDTINSTIAQLAGATVGGLGGTDTLNITNAVTTAVTLGGGGAGGSITGVEALVLQGGSSALVTVPTVGASGIATITLGAAGQVAVSSGQTVNGSEGADAITAGGANMSINAAGGSDTVTFTSRSGLTSSDTVNGGSGTDTLTVGIGTGAAGDFNNVSGFETINDPTAVITAPNSLVAAGATLNYVANVGGVGVNPAAAIDFSAETDGTVNITVGLGGGTVRGPTNLLSDTITLPTGHAATTLVFATGTTVAAGNTVAQIVNADKVSGFNVAADKFAVPYVPAGGYVVPAFDATSSATAVASLNAALAAGLTTLAVGDLVIATSGGRTYLFQNLSGTNIDAGDFVIETVNSPGTLTSANFSGAAPPVSGPSSFTVTANGQSFTGAGGADTFIVGDVYSSVTLDGAGGTDTLTIANNAGLVGTSSITGIEVVNLGTTTALTAGLNTALQAPGVTINGLGGSADTFQIGTAGGGSTTTTGIAAVERYFLVVDTTLTLGSASQSVTSVSAASTINSGGFGALTGTFTSGSANTTLNLSASNTDLSGATFAGAPFKLAVPAGGNVTYLDDQAAQFASVATAGTIKINNRSGGAVALSNFTAGTLDLSGLTGGHTVTASAASDGFTNINLGAANLNLTSTAPFSTAGVSALGGSQTISVINGNANIVNIAGNVTGVTSITLGTGDDTVNWNNRNSLGSNDSINGGLGSDTLNVAAGTFAGNDFNNVRGFEKINDFQGVITSVDGLIDPGATLAYRVTSTAAVAISFAAERDGRVNVTIVPEGVNGVNAAAGGAIEGTNNSLRDTFNLGKGRAIGLTQTTVVDFDNGGQAFAGNRVSNLANVDSVAYFNVASDRLDLPLLAGSILNNGYTFTNSPTELNPQIALLGSLTAGNVVIAFSGGNTYVIQNISGSDIDANDVIIELTSLVGNNSTFGSGNFI